MGNDEAELERHGGYSERWRHEHQNGADGTRDNG
jgi:hypothetical protein